MVSITWRFGFILGIIYLAAIGLVWRLYTLTVLDQSFLQKQSNERILRLLEIPSMRGMFLDRNGFPLAVSTKVYSVWLNPFEFSPTKDNLSTLSHLLNMRVSQLMAITQTSLKMDREFIYVKRALAPTVAHQVENLHLPGLYTEINYHRYYPEGETMAQVLGLTNIDDNGQEGLELTYNRWLQGTKGKQWVLKDRLGRAIVNLKTIHPQTPGHHVVLSLDRRIQYVAYRALLEGMQNYLAAAGTAIVLDVETGEILGMVNYPSFNPNDRTHAIRDAMRNRAITDVFEPGSTLKIFSIASALEGGHVTPDTIIDTTPGWLRVGHNVIRDVHESGRMTVTQVLQRSSNVGVTKIILSLPSGRLENVLQRVGFGEPSGVDFPGEQLGVFNMHHALGAFPLATLAFGYGISVTPLQLVRAYAVIARGGTKIPITLLKSTRPPQSEKVMDESVAKKLQLMLQSVIDKKGTGYLAHVPGYCVAGKTGTTVKVGKRGYEKHHYIASFIGMAPCDHPRLIVAVFVHDPHGAQYYGGMVAGPIFSKIMEGALRVLNITPDVTS